MNFKKVQGIFLIAFIVIDVFLFSMIIHNQNMQNPSTGGNSSNSTMIKEMKRDSITVGRVSNQKGSGYYISARPNYDLKNAIQGLKGQNATFENGMVDSDFDSPFHFNLRQPNKTLDQLIKNKSFIARGENYQFDPTQSNGNKVVYIQKVFNSSFLTPEAEIVFKVNNGRIMGYTQTGLNDVKILHESSKTISGQRALIWLYQYNDIPNNTRILSTQLGYTKLLEIKGNSVYIPSWVITLRTKNSNNTTVKRINAFSGALLKTETVNDKTNVNSLKSGTEAN